MIFGGESLGQRAECAACFGARENVAERCEGFDRAAKLALKGVSTQTFAPAM